MSRGSETLLEDIRATEIVCETGRCTMLGRHTHIRHPFEAIVSAIVVVVGLWEAKETFFRIAARGGQVPHDLECLLVNRWRYIHGLDSMCVLGYEQHSPRCLASPPAWLTW